MQRDTGNTLWGYKIIEDDTVKNGDIKLGPTKPCPECGWDMIYDPDFIEGIAWTWNCRNPDCGEREYV